MRNAGRRITRAMIIEHVWNLSFDTCTNVVDVYVNYLRRKVDDGYGKHLIHTIRGVGYELSALSRRAPATGATRGIMKTKVEIRRCRRTTNFASCYPICSTS